MYAVALGEMFDGVVFHGPFEDFEDAANFGDESGQNWWVVELKPTINE
jgi:hypothetical protein